MKLSALAALITLFTVTSAQGYGGGYSAGGSGAGRGAGASGGAGGGAGGGIPSFLIPFLQRVSRATIAHGVLMCLAFVIFFPAGSVVVRLGRSNRVVYVHAGIQMFAYILALAGMGLGVYVANAPTKAGRESKIHAYHPVIGLTIIAALLFQPALGALHHAVYVREQRKSIWSTLHVWWGRLILTFAIIEGGLGLKFADNTTGGEIAYGVVAGIVWVCWLGVAIWHDMKKTQPRKVRDKRAELEKMTPTGQGEARSV